MQDQFIASLKLLIAKIFARVNQPAYLRFLYTLADQKRILLVDNFYIGQDKVNSDVEIDTFRCVPPFGTEFLFVAARTEKFPPIETREENGFTVLVEQDAESAVKSWRGLRRIQNRSDEQQLIGPKPFYEEQPEFQQSEAQLVITVEEKKD
ncbi:DUF4384 domain-containing protein [Candidatus Poribacteria bacterium]|nr:DUF4384 domain-containing protein [Candidatus Poribacteria bacterium]